MKMVIKAGVSDVFELCKTKHKSSGITWVLICRNVGKMNDNLIVR